MVEILDLERINELTADENEFIEKSGYGGGSNSKYPTSRKIIREYIQVYMDYIGPKNNKFSNIDGEFMEIILETLRYNKILINKRAKKLAEVLDD